jgi:cell division protein FtsL
MRIVRSGIAICLAIILAAPAASAQQTHVIGKAALEKAVQDRAAQDRDDRAAIRSLLQRADVREIAAKAGLSIEKAERAIAVLDGDDLRQAAAHARQAQDNLAGGATVVITTTTILLILLVIIIIILLAD